MKGRNSKKTEGVSIQKNLLRFTVSMDKDLFKELLRITGQKKSRAVSIACKDFVRMKQKESLLTLKGSINSRK